MAVDAEFVQAVPLIEYGKGLEEGSLERAFIETFTAVSDVAAVFPIRPATNSKYKFRRTAELPVVGHRGYNEPGNESIGRTTRHEEGVYLMDEYIKVDRAEVDELGEGERIKQERMKIIAMSRHFTNVLLKGDNETNPREPSGLQNRATELNRTLFHNSVAAGGAPLSLNNLDLLISNTNNPNYLIITLDMQHLFIGAARNPNLTNSTIIIDDNDPLGRKVMSYNGIPILWGYPRDDGDAILPFTEVGAGGGAAQTTSIYCVGFETEGVFGIEGTPLNVDDEGKIKGVPVLSTHIKWDFGFVNEHPRKLSRLTSITQAAIVA